MRFCVSEELKGVCNEGITCTLVPVEVFGRKIRPGQLIHADKHGFLVIPKEDETPLLLEAAHFMDSNECNTKISNARSTTGKTIEELLSSTDEASVAFGAAALKKFGKRREW